MAKISWNPGTMLFPIPAVMVTSGDMEKPSVMTIAWTGIINSEPPMTYISVRPSRNSYNIIKQNKEFVINITTLALSKACDYCGVKSGKNTDKFKDMELEIEPCSKVKAPMLKKAPVSLECKVTESKLLGSHEMFIAEIVNVNIDEQYLEEDGRLALEKAGLLVFAHGRYYTMGRDLGAFGFSVDKTKENKTKPRKSKFEDILRIEQQIKEATTKIKQGIKTKPFKKAHKEDEKELKGKDNHKRTFGSRAHKSDIERPHKPWERKRNNSKPFNNKNRNNRGKKKSGTNNRLDQMADKIVKKALKNNKPQTNA